MGFGKVVSAYLVLLPVGFAMPFVSPQTRCALTAPFHPYREQLLVTSCWLLVKKKTEAVFSFPLATSNQ